MSVLLLLACLSSSDQSTPASIGEGPSGTVLETLDCGKGVLALNSWENKKAQPDLSWPGGALPTIELCAMRSLLTCKVQAAEFKPSQAELGFATRIEGYEEHPVWLKVGEGTCALPTGKSHRAQIGPCPAGELDLPKQDAALQVQCANGEVAWAKLEDFLAAGGTQL